MKADRAGVLEFRTRIGRDGNIVLPRGVSRAGTLRRGALVSVQVKHASLPLRLRNRGVTEDEVQRIAAVQMEPREQVMKFLLAEGSLQRRVTSRPRAK